MTFDLVNSCMNAAGLLLGCIVGVFSFFWIRPAERRMRHLEAEIAKQNARHDKILSALIDARVGHRKETHQKCCEACSVIYKAFLHVDSSSWILTILKDLKNLSEIQLQSGNQTDLRSFSLWLQNFIPQGWQKAAIVEEAKAVEPFASERIWQLYELAKGLLFCAQTKIAELQLGLAGSLLDEQKLYSHISLFFPEERPCLEKRGTSHYSRILERCRLEMKNEIRKTFGMEPINTEFAKTLEADMASVFGVKPPEIPKEFQEVLQKDFEN